MSIEWKSNALSVWSNARIFNNRSNCSAVAKFLTNVSMCAHVQRSSGEGKGSERKIRDMEAVVLQVLGWKLLGVTTADFVDNMLAHLPLSGVPSPLVRRARRRADELIQVVLTGFANLNKHCIIQVKKNFAVHPATESSMTGFYSRN